LDYLPGPTLGNIFTIEYDSSRISLQYTEYASDKGGFSGAVGANETNDSIPFYLEAYIVDSKQAAKAFG